MTLPASGSERVFWAILIVLVLCYMLGSWLNRRRGEHIGRWLQAGLAKLGGRPAWKILRSISSAAQVNIGDAAPPFRQVQVTYALLTRELPPLWAVEWGRGRRDTLAVRADLRAEPAGEIEVVPKEGHLRRQIDRLAAGRPWEWRAGPATLGIATRGPVAAATLDGIDRFIAAYGPQVQRISLQPHAAGTRLVKAADGRVALNLPAGPRDLTRSSIRPHLLVFLNLGQIEAAPAARLFDDLRNLARSAQPAQQP